MQFGSMPEKRTIDAIFIMRKLQEYHAKIKKLCMHLMDLENALDSMPKKVLEWSMRKNGKPEVLVRSVVSLYEGAKTSQSGLGREDSHVLRRFNKCIKYDCSKTAFVGAKGFYTELVPAYHSHKF